MKDEMTEFGMKIALLTKEYGEKGLGLNDLKKVLIYVAHGMESACYGKNVAKANLVCEIDNLQRCLDKGEEYF